jgi:hypothetical protein
MSRLFLSLAVLFLTVTTSFAQVAGRLSGTVVDATGASVPNAKISLFLTGGETAVLTTETTGDGLFEFASVRPDYYRLTIEAPGFVVITRENIKIDPGRVTSLPPLTLEVSATAQTVEVSAASETVNTATAEVATTVTQEQVENLPILDRQINYIFVTQAGVSNSRTVTSINGLRPSYTNIMLDGVNVQDTVRTNAVDLVPNRLTIGQIEEATFATSNISPTVGGNATAISLTTKSGTNEFHGKGYWFNRNSYFSANDWFNNAEGVDRPFLNLNQIGGQVGGPIVKDKLLFMVDVEAFRLRQQTPLTNTILLPSARQGLLTYVDATGTRRTFDVLGGRGITIDPYVRGLLEQLPAAGNSLSRGDQLNTTGYSFNSQDNDSREIYSGKLDYYVSDRHSLSGTYTRTQQVVDRPDYTGFYTTVPTIYNDVTANFASATWRWSVTPTLTNEFRAGLNNIPVKWVYRGGAPEFTLTGLNFTSPVNPKLEESRDVRVFAFQDNANWVKGRHTFAFGFHAYLWKSGSNNSTGVVPAYTVGISTTNPNGYRVGDIPGASATDINRANAILASLGGMISGATQTFNITSRDSGFVPGAPQILDLRMNNYAPYFQDTWKLTRRVTLTLGMRWEYFSPVNETSGFLVQPRLIDDNPVVTLLSNATLDFAGTSAGRPLYKKEFNNFAPNVGLAWDVFGDGRTALRAGYNIAYANDNTLNTVYNAIVQNPGLSTSLAQANLNARITGSRPNLAAPPFRFPTTTLDQFNLSPSSPPVEGLIHPELKTPYVQQWNVSLQQDWKGFVFEGRYVGNHVVGQLRQIDFNQIDINRGGFLDDFRRARNNGLLAYRATGVFNATYNPNISGSQPLQFFNRMPSGGFLTNPAVVPLLQSNEPGTLGQLYQSNLLFPTDDPNFSWFPNRLLLYSSMLTNISHSTYNALQVEARRRIRGGIQLQANYTFSKALSDAEATRGLEAILDNNNFSLEKARSPFDLTHAFKLNHHIPLPFGRGRRFAPASAFLDRIVGGWAMSGFLLIQSGPPVSIEAGTGTAGVGRGTLNRGARSSNNTVDTTLTLPQLRDATGLYKTGNGVFFIDPRHIHPVTGNGVAPDIDPPFAGQIFFNPQAGTVGSLQRRILEGPGFWDYDFSLLKDTRITERHSIQLRADFFNLFNHPNFFAGDMNVNSATFGRITGLLISGNGVGNRMVQFGLTYNF